MKQFRNWIQSPIWEQITILCNKHF